jgi:hypothetical protein
MNAKWKEFFGQCVLYKPGEYNKMRRRHKRDEARKKKIFKPSTKTEESRGDS